MQSGAAGQAGAMSRDEVTITPYRDGPLVVRGPFVITDQDGEDIEVGRRTVALCRCGKSRIRPFCDGTHGRAGFQSLCEASMLSPPKL